MAPTLKITEEIHPLLQNSISELQKQRLSIPFSIVALLFALLIVGVGMLSYLVQGLNQVPAALAWLSFLHLWLARSPAILLLLAVLMEILGRSERFQHLEPAVPFMLWSVVILLSASTLGDTVTNLKQASWLNSHLLLSLLSMLTVMAAVLLRWRERERGQDISKTYWIVLCLAMTIALLSNN